jgi:hypothetical protein
MNDERYIGNQMNHINTLVKSVLISTLMVSPFSFGEMSKPRQPPEAAFTACEGKSAGDSTQFETRRGKTLTGKCEIVGGDNAGKLVLRPDNLKRKNKMRKQPPQAAYTACNGKSIGDSAQFETRRGKTLPGTCEELNSQLVLRPQRQ